jgi:hypothetical protein
MPASTGRSLGPAPGAAARVEHPWRYGAWRTWTSLPPPRASFSPTSSWSQIRIGRRWYEQVLGAKTVLEQDPMIMKVANSWIILNVGGGPTEDKPDVTLETPPTRSAPAHSSTSESRTSHRSISSGEQPKRSSGPNRRIDAPRSAVTCVTRTATLSRSANPPASAANPSRGAYQITAAAAMHSIAASSVPTGGRKTQAGNHWRVWRGALLKGVAEPVESLLGHASFSAASLTR